MFIVTYISEIFLKCMSNHTTLF